MIQPSVGTEKDILFENLLNGRSSRSFETDDAAALPSLKGTNTSLSGDKWLRSKLLSLPKLSRMVVTRIPQYC